jgi:hypothetical protein
MEEIHQMEVQYILYGDVTKNPPFLTKSQLYNLDTFSHICLNYAETWESHRGGVVML